MPVTRRHSVLKFKKHTTLNLSENAIKMKPKKIIPPGQPGHKIFKIRQILPNAAGIAKHRQCDIYNVKWPLNLKFFPSVASANMGGDLEESSSSPAFVCHICSKSSRTRSELRQHVFCHLRHEIQSKYYPDNVIKNCLECNYKSSIGEHVLMHLVSCTT